MNRASRYAFLITTGMAFLSAQELTMGLSVNGSGTASLDRGRALIVHAVIYARTEIPVVLAVQDGAHWTSALQLSAEKDGGPLPWPLRLVPPEEGTARLELKGGASAQATWLLAPEDTTQLEPGRYTLRVSLNSNSAPPVAVEIRESPAEPTEDNEAANSILESHYQEITGNAEAAYDAIASLLERYPANLRALARKAELLTVAGRFSEAVQVYNSAIKAFAEKMPDATHPPRELIYLRNEARWRALGLPE